MKCDFCNEKATLTAGYHYCPKHIRGLDRIAIHIILIEAYPTLTLERIKQFCVEMFGIEDYGFSTFPVLYKIHDRGKMYRDARNEGWYKKPQALYLIETFELFIQDKYPKFWERIKNDRVVKHYTELP